MMRFALGIMLLALAACQQAPMPETTGDPTRATDAALAQDGRDIAEAQCAACHAVGEFGDSPMAQAPPFRVLLSRYRADVLEEELISGIRVAHPMPDFQFNPQGADALIAYLRSIQQPAAD